MVKGYTLIELTIVVGLVAILAIGISSVVLMNTVTANRTRNLAHLRESGDYALGQLKQLVRNAKNIESCNSTTNTLTLIGQDGGSTEIALELESEIGRIASGSANYLTPSDITISALNLTCLPDDLEPTLVKVSFTASLATETQSKESPVLNFETSISLRND